MLGRMCGSRVIHGSKVAFSYSWELFETQSLYCGPSQFAPGRVNRFELLFSILTGANYYCSGVPRASKLCGEHLPALRK